MSGTTGTSTTYSFGSIFIANLFDYDVRTGVTDWNAAALDMLGGFSDATLGVLSKVVSDGGLSAGGQLIDANGKALDVAVGVGSGEHAAAASGSAFDGWETAVTVAGGFVGSALGSELGPVGAAAGGYFGAKFAQSVYDYFNQTQGGNPIQTTAGEYVQDFTNGVADMGQMAANMASDIVGGAQTAMSQLGSALESIGSDAASGLAAVGNAFADGLGQLASGLGDMLSQIGQYIANSPMIDPETGTPLNPFAPPSPGNPSPPSPPGSPDSPGGSGDPAAPPGGSGGVGGAAGGMGGGNRQTSPLVLDLTGNGLRLTALSYLSPYFDLTSSGFATKAGWIGRGTGLLCLDRNGDHDAAFVSPFYVVPVPGLDPGICRKHSRLRNGGKAVDARIREHDAGKPAPTEGTVSRTATPSAAIAGKVAASVMRQLGLGIRVATTCNNLPQSSKN